MLADDGTSTALRKSCGVYSQLEPVRRSGNAALICLQPEHCGLSLLAR